MTEKIAQDISFKGSKNIEIDGKFYNGSFWWKVEKILKFNQQPQDFEIDGIVVTNNKLVDSGVTHCYLCGGTASHDGNTQPQVCKPGCPNTINKPKFAEMREDGFVTAINLDQGNGVLVKNCIIMNNVLDEFKMPSDTIRIEVKI